MPPAADVPALIVGVRAVSRVARLLERATGELTLAQYRVLSAVDAGDERASRIAQRLAVGKPTVSAVVDSLCKRELLTRSDVAEDLRAAALALTPLGRTTLAEVEAAMCAQLADLVARTPDAHGLLASLGGLDAAIEQRLAERAADRA
ncbi:MAG TPA: MarR family winged helix-turn-helix transcriptional regulator [Marmoricola sp.]|nr:MarR family winged helix-turn-helix transcriptional regulator [Marmoricola sp.]